MYFPDPIPLVIALVGLIGFVAVAMVMSAASKRRQPIRLKVEYLLPQRWTLRVIVIVLPAALLLSQFMAAAGEPAAEAWTLIAGLVVALAAGFAELLAIAGRIRRVEDTPTSRIRSAAQGYVEVHGKAAPV